MTMHVVLGDGEMTRRELTETLNDLWNADQETGQSFWFMLQGKSEPTDTDKALVTWLEKEEIYYELVTDDPDAVSDIYSQPQEVHTAKKIAPKVVALLTAKPEEEEPAEILALFFDVNDATAAEDRWLNGVITAAGDAGFPTRALNDGLVEIDLAETSAAAEAEPAVEEAAPAKPVKKAVAKKATADSPIPDDAVEEVASSAGRLTGVGTLTTTPQGDGPYIPTRAELQDMEPSEIKEVAAQLGIVLPPRTRSTTYIDHILGEARAAASTVTIEDVPEVALNGNGYVDPDDIAVKVADLLWERFRKVFVDAE